tara:strand:+ start:113 stop:814 length:702 start_codon:yes stop_codon:yes gene_type:complete
MENENLKVARLKSLNNLRNEKKNRYKNPQSLKNFIINKLFINSFFYKILLSFLGIKVGINTKFLGPINFIIIGKIENISLGDDILFHKNITLKVRENGKIIINNKVVLDENVRLVAAREGAIEIGEGTNIGANTIINSGGIVKIGKYCLISNNCNINSSSHGTSIKNFIIDQSHNHGKIIIENDVWLGGFVTISIDSHLKEGVIVGANSFVNSILSEFSINAGCPTKQIGSRE